MDELKKEVLDFLKSNYIMSIAVSEDNFPTSAIILYYVDDDFNFHFATHTDSYKAKKLKKNSKISISVWQPEQMLIQADGNAEEVQNPAEKLEIVDNLAESATKGENFWPPLFRIGGEDYIVFRIKLNWMRKLDLVQDTITQEESPLTEIIL